MVVYRNPSEELSSSELSIKATVERLKVTVLFSFLNRVKVSSALPLLCILSSILANIGELLSNSITSTGLAKT